MSFDGPNGPKGPHAGTFKAGTSGNPGGYSKAKRAERRAFKEALDKAFTAGEGSERVDLLVGALVRGVEAGDPTCTRLACEYRFGKPTESVEVTDGEGEPLGLVVSFVRPTDDAKG
jgi:hypothetical protein